MRYLLSLLLIFLFVPFFSSAQGNYLPGVVVNLKGDTIRGFIDYREWENNPESILFKPGAASTAAKLTTDSISFFSVAVGHLSAYVAYTGNVSADITDIQHLSIGRDTSHVPAKVFLRVVQKGKNLLIFTLTDTRKTRFFMARNFSEKPVELIYQAFYNSSEENGYDRTQYDYTFKSQLYQVAENSGVLNASLEKQIKSTEYKEPDLLRTAGLINSISEKDLAKNNPQKIKGVYKALAVVVGIAIIILLIHDFAAVNSHH
jgi:hypothetical protein